MFRAEHCSVIAYRDSVLHPAYQFRNCWVKPLPQKDLLRELLKYKNHLQTVALVCEPERKAELEALLAKTGIVQHHHRGTHVNKLLRHAPRRGIPVKKVYEDRIGGGLNIPPIPQGFHH